MVRPLRQFSAEDLAAARALLAEETKGVAAAMGHEGVAADGYLEAWRATVDEWVLDGKVRCVQLQLLLGWGLGRTMICARRDGLFRDVLLHCAHLCLVARCGLDSKVRLCAGSWGVSGLPVSVRWVSVGGSALTNRLHVALLLQPAQSSLHSCRRLHAVLPAGCFAGWFFEG
jgi:hypothetical protein